MLYLNENDIRELGLDWERSIAVIEQTVRCHEQQECAQPIKPYLRYGDPSNRIIAMPAYVGGELQVAGIKWIASFPGNLSLGKPRAHSVVILNRGASGEPVCIINTPLLSGIRTAAVSGLMVQQHLKGRPGGKLDVGIIGFGPIGRLHLDMIWQQVGERIDRIYLYDLKGIDTAGLDPALKSRVTVCDSWLPCYQSADIFITCTVSAARYLKGAPKPDALLLNVSLRDFEPEIIKHAGLIVVDDWEEVCRENTDIELMHRKYHLQKEDTRSLVDVVCGGCLDQRGAGEAVLFSPMGMAIFDVATAAQYYRLAQSRGVGTRLDA